MFFSIVAIFFAIAIPYFEPYVRRHRALAQSVGVTICAHQATSILQVALHGLPTMQMDPISFNSYALTGEGRLAHDAYAKFLHFLYSTFESSHFFGCQISNIFFSLALLVQIRLLLLMGYRTSLPKLVLIFGLLPSCVLNTAVTLREAAQMFCYLSIALILLTACRRGLTPKTLLLIPVSMLLIHLHQGMAPLLLAVIPISLAFALQARPAVVVFLAIVTLSGGVLVKDQVIRYLSEKSTVLQRLTEGDLEYLEKYADNVGESRTSFGVSLDLSSPAGILKTGPVLLSYYLFSPLPWQIRGALDILGMFESILRLLLFFYAVQTLVKTSSAMRREQLLMGLLFLSIEIAWSIGTANWGTAFRHRLVAWGILVAAGGRLFGEEPTLDASTPTKDNISLRERRRVLAKRRNSLLSKSKATKLCSI